MSDGGFAGDDDATREWRAANHLAADISARSAFVASFTGVYKTG